MLSSVPNHPALGLLFPNQQGSLTAKDSTQTRHSRVEKRKTRGSDEADSYEVEEILDHRRDNHASF
jgi:hypothetical protein